MCGISGIYSKDENLEKYLNLFNKCLSNRGPDSCSFFVDKKNYFGMAHTRLAILDLSSKGNQPMYDHSGEWVICFNGEIYNHKELRNDLEQKTGKKIIWKSNSDTETILMANYIFGFEKTLNLLEGMFAFALYNIKNSILYLARDRIGEKPLYYYNYENKFIFGSDLSIFKKLKNINLTIDKDTIAEYIQKGNIGAPKSIYKFISKLTPGNYIKISDDFSKITKNCYWDLKKVVVSNTKNRKKFITNFFEEKNNLKKLLEKTVMKQTISDVQIGSFLSGGVDSSIITSILQMNNNNQIKTFTVGFEDKNFDESKQAKKISDYLGTNHYEFFIQDNHLLDFTENLNDIYTEPFSDSSQIPTYLIAKLMKKEAKVILSGDGGDELYGGYNRYLYLNYIKFFSKNLPEKLKKKLNYFLKIIPIETLNRYLAFLNIKNFKIKITKFINFINTSSDLELYNEMICRNPNQYYLIDQSAKNIKNFNLKKEFIEDLSTEENFMYHDQIDYLPNDILCKVDRATMHNSIEGRSPFLDHKVIEHSWKIPLKFKIKNNTGKLILREILNDYLPKNLIQSHKSGFAIPLDDLLRTKLKLWVEDILSSSSNINNYINFENAKILWNRHKKKNINAGETIWSILVLQNWLINHQK